MSESTRSELAEKAAAETAILKSVREELAEGIKAEMIEFTDTVLDFGFTSSVFVNDKGSVWHEFLITETNLLMFARINPEGFVETTLDKEDLK